MQCSSYPVRFGLSCLFGATHLFYFSDHPISIIMALSINSSLSAVVAHFKDLGMEEVAKTFQGKHLFYLKPLFFYLVYLVKFFRVVRHISLAMETADPQNVK